MNENASNNTVTMLKDIIIQKNLSKIFVPVSAIDVSDDRIKNALGLFVSNVETNGSVSVADILFSAGDLVGKSSLNEAAGNLIFAYDKPALNKKIIKNTAVGLYRLLRIHNGISLDLDAVGGNLISAELKNYLIIPQNKIKKYSAIAEKEGIQLKKAGCVLSGASIIICNGDCIIETLDKSEFNVDPVDSISLDSRHFADFYNAYTSFLSYVLCKKIVDNNAICFGISDDLETIFARAIGIFAAALSTRSFFYNLKFLNDDKVFNVSPRPIVSDGEYFYLLKLRNNTLGLPDMVHFNQLERYLAEYKNHGIIKNVLPYRENISGTLKRLCTDSLTFEAINETYDSCFGVVVSVGRGQSLNGQKLGFFRNI